MSNAAKKQRNREYYLKNRERILTKAKARKRHKRASHLEVVPALENKTALHSAEAIGVSEKSADCQTVQATGAERTSEPMDVAESLQSVVDSVRVVSALSEIVSMPESENELNSGNTGVAQMNRRLKLAGTVSEKREVSSESEQKAENVMAIGSDDCFSRIPLSFMLRLLLVVGLTILMTAMQVAFYREHDILPGYAVPLALASELAFLSLVTMKFSRGLEWLRIMVHLTFFGYFVSALSFHVYAKTRIKAASQPSVTVSESTEIRDQLRQAERSLEVAIKGRAWKNMEIFGAEVSRLSKLISERPNVKVLGTSPDQALWVEAILLILLRALLLAASALNALRLRDQIHETILCARTNACS